MMILEVAGRCDPEKIQTLLQEGETFECLPYAALGDFSVCIRMERNDGRADQIITSMLELGYEVVGWRWKKRDHERRWIQPVSFYASNHGPGKVQAGVWWKHLWFMFQHRTFD